MPLLIELRMQVTKSKMLFMCEVILAPWVVMGSVLMGSVRNAPPLK